MLHFDITGFNNYSAIENGHSSYTELRLHKESFPYVVVVKGNEGNMQVLNFFHDSKRHSISFGFVCLVVASWVAVWVLYSGQQSQITIPLQKTSNIRGIVGVDAAGTWFGSQTQINVQRYADFGWRTIRWRWCQAPGLPLDVQMQLQQMRITTHTDTHWRVVSLLMPPASTADILQITSSTLRVAGDERDLGVLISSLTIYHGVASWHNLPEWLVLLGIVTGYWLPLGAAGIWLWRSRWLGLAIWGLLSLVYLVMVYQETHTGFANPSLWLDSRCRSVSVLAMLYFAWRQRQVQPNTIFVLGTGRRFGLDVMRAIAVLCVMVAHFTALTFVEWSGDPFVFRWFVHLGSIGVDIFFALSGYLIGGILLRNLPRINDFAVVTRFWMRRWLRTLPAAYVSALVVWMIAAPKNSGEYIKSILFVGSFNPLHQSIDLSFWWSLSTEELFYFLFPLLLFLIIKNKPYLHAFIMTLIFFAGIAMLVRVTYQIVLPLEMVDNINVTSYVRLDSMVWGIVLQLVRTQRPTWFGRLAQMGFAPGVVLFSVGVMLLVDQQRWFMPQLFWSHIMITVGAVLVIPVIESVTTLGSQSFNRLVSWIALISYSLYLYHVMMVIFLARTFNAATTWPILGALFGAYIALTFGVATLSYYFVEAPVLRWRNRAYPE